MRSPGERWRITVLGGSSRSCGHASTRGRVAIAIASGVLAGLLVTALSAFVTGQAAPLTILPVLVSTLVAGRVVSTWPALLHGACAWLVMVLGRASLQTSSHAWHGMSVLWVLLLLIEDMAIIGRVGYVRQQIARRHKQV